MVEFGEHFQFPAALGLPKPTAHIWDSRDFCTGGKSHWTARRARTLLDLDVLADKFVFMQACISLF